VGITLFICTRTAGKESRDQLTITTGVNLQAVQVCPQESFSFQECEAF